MESISHECTPAKKKYEDCFNTWYATKFLKGITDNTCDELFREYQKCALGAVQAKGIKLEDVKFNESVRTQSTKETPK